MEQKQWKDKWDYKPDCTPGALERERMLQSFNLPPEERFTRFIGLIRPDYNVYPGYPATNYLQQAA